jgi:hypothetical protein
LSPALHLDQLRGGNVRGVNQGPISPTFYAQLL